MPTYLCHGFRWQRPNITIHVILQNLDDASPDWIIPPRSSRSILESFYALHAFLPYCVPPPCSSPSVSLSSHDSTRRGNDNSEGDSRSSSSRPETTKGNAREQLKQSRSGTPSQHVRDPSTRHGPPLPQQPGTFTPGDDTNPSANLHDELQSQDWSVVKLLEEYDPNNLNEVSRPYAYVADHVVRIDLSLSIFDEMAKYEERVRTDRSPAMIGPSDEKMPGSETKKSGKKQTGWFEKLRDQVQGDEEIRWYVVVNGDEVRDYPVAGAGVSRDGELEEAGGREEHSDDMFQQHIAGGKVGSLGHETMLVPERLRKGAGEKQVPAESFAERERPKPKLKPKPSSKSGFRRLFGRSKTDGLPE